MTPREHLGVLVEPPVPRLHAALHRRPDAGFENVIVLDTTLAALRTRLRERLKLSGPVILTGHQPEFAHAGIFAKTIAAHALAGQVGGQAVFLTVDSDLPKTTQLVLPQTTSRGVRRIDVAIPGCDPQRPFEWQTATPREHWFQFFARLASMHEFYDRSLLRPFVDGWLAMGDRPPWCAALAGAHRATEAVLGLEGVRELRVSQVCATPEFRTFAAHLVLDAAECAERYNTARAAYRQRHRVRAPGWPVPPLEVRNGVAELPLWITGPGQPRRRLSAAVRGEVVELSADGVLVSRVQREELSRAAAHGEPWLIERDGWFLRPRALALTALARLLLADLFVHGVGGAKYDEIMEDFVGGYFGVEPIPACCVTATVHLPLPHSGLRRSDIAVARQRSRDLRYNPQRHLGGLPDEVVERRAALARRSDDLRAHQPCDHVARRLVFREIRRLNEQMLALDPWRPAAYDQRVQTLEEQWQLDRIALDREYFYALHLQQTLEELVGVIRQGLAATEAE